MAEEAARIRAVTALYGDSRCHSAVAARPDLWEQALFHPFLRGCRADAAAPRTTAAQFNRWLTQDHQFVGHFLDFARRLHANAPEHHREQLAGGLAALEDELQWFQRKAAERGLDLSSPQRSPACQAYIEKLQEAGRAPYPLQAAFFWVIEFAYNEAWLRNAPFSEEFREYGERWGTAEFSHYVAGLCRQADEACAGATEAEWKQVEEWIMWTAEIEIAFWADATAHGA